jgi:flagellar hook protein FlgE
MSFQQGLSGLNATSKNLEIIGNNIANSNTYGAKSSRAEFADVYAASLNGSGANQIGIGTRLQAVSQQFTQGNITTTENPMDLAINGAGFFQVTDGKSPTMYSRNGQFKVDRDGYVINNEGLQLIGYPADATGTIQQGTSKPLQLPTAGISPARTEDMKLEMNLDSRAGGTVVASVNPVPSPAPATGAVDPTLPTIDFTNATTYNNATSVTIYDEKGQDIALTYYFQKSGTDTWNVYATANGQSLSNSPRDPSVAVDPVTNPNVPRPVAQISFPANGGPATGGAPTGGTVTSYDDTFTTSTSSITGKITLPQIPQVTLASGGLSLPIPSTWPPTSTSPAVSVDMPTSTQYGTAFAVTNLTQDGNAPGQLSSITVESNGIVMARYSNGQAKAAGQVVLATFRNPQGLQAQGGNVWAQTFASGTPILGTPGQGNFGDLASGSLEESNIDLTAELVNMITAQRVYQANAQTIKTQDQVMQTLVNLR